MSARGVLAFVAALTVLTSPVASQTIRVGIHSVTMTHTEIDESYSTEGVGPAGTLILRWRRLGLELMGLKTAMKSDTNAVASYDLVQWDARLDFWLAPVIAIEIGGMNRKIDPEFSAPDVAAVRIGFVSEYPLARIASVRARGAYLVNPRFNTGGSSGLAVEIGLGVAVGTSNGRFRVKAESDFQRIDREVNGADAPIQVTMARLGVEVGF